MNDIAKITPIAVVQICPLVEHFPLLKERDKRCEPAKTQAHYRNEHPGCECHNGIECLVRKIYPEMAVVEIREREQQERSHAQYRRIMASQISA